MVLYLIGNCYSKVIDTNILIYHLNDSLEDHVEQFLQKAIESNSYLSVITALNCLAGLNTLKTL